MPEPSPRTDVSAPRLAPVCRSDWSGLASRIIIAAGAIAAYGRTFSVPLLLDDNASIAENLSIHRLWPVWTALSPPDDAGVGGRPLLNLSYALNYAFGGTSVFGYHLVNLLIHVLAGWTLFALVRSTVRRPILAERFGSSATVLALAISAIWTWHPVQTESVTYLSQRAESLMGLFYLLTLYCFVRGAETDRKGQGRIWFSLSVLACLAGVATKEVIVTAPLLVFLYDRTFISGNFSGAWRRHRPLYLALAATWLPLGYLMMGLPRRAVGFGAGVAWWSYGLAEGRVMVEYLLLAFWPRPLVFDYGMFAATRLSEVWPYFLVLAVLLTATARALFLRPAEQRVFRPQSPPSLSRWRRLPRRSSRPASEDGRPSGFGGQALGFAGAWFFLLLAPTSSIVPIAGQPMAESRLYLPLAAVAALMVLGAFSLAGRRSVPVLFAAAVSLLLASVQRNRDYSSAVAIWSDTIAKRPANARAHTKLGNALDETPGRWKDAIAQFDLAVHLEPNYSEAYSNRAGAYVETGEYHRAISDCTEAIHLKPDFASAYINRAGAYVRTGDFNRAIADCNVAIRLEPDSSEAYNNRASAYAKTGDYHRAIVDCDEAIRLEPNFAEAYVNRSFAYVKLEGYDRAIADCGEAIRLNPRYAEAYSIRAFASVRKGDCDRAIADCNEAINLDANYAEAYGNRADADVRKGAYDRAVADYTQAIRLNPGFATAYDNVAWLWATCPAERIRSGPKAMAYAQKACDLTEWKEAADIDTLAAACAEAGHFEEAVKWETRYIESSPTKDAADSARQRLGLYARRKAYHEELNTN